MKPLDTQLNDIHDLARSQADSLRHQAMDDFWRGADALLHSAAHSACRSAQLFAQRLVRHKQNRARDAAGGAATPDSTR
jgi:hypothetical protein